MRAMVLTGHGDLSKLEFHEEWPTPTVQDHEVLIKIGACGLNNTDVNTRTAWYSKGVSDATTGEAFQDADDEDGTWGGAAVTFPRIQGADAVGRVVALGNNAPSSLLGERVMIDTWLRDWSDPDNYDKCGYFGSECDGGYAEYVSVSSRQVHSVKSDLTDTELATFATSYITAENMLNRANVAAGDTVLISGASGGVGSALIQLANRRGGQTVAMASETKHEELREYKPTVLLNRSPENLAQCLTESIGKPTVSVVADVVGGDYWSELINVLQRKGRYTCAGAIAGPMVNMDLRTFYLRDLTFTGATIVPPGIFADLVGYIERGEVKPMLAKTYPLKNLREAQTAFIEKSHVGNIVVEI
ncbi:MAG: alcohol dehydrogenase family protein [Pseudomonadota bacterium]